MKKLQMFGALLAMSYVAGAASFDWSGGSGLDIFWATPGNWSPPSVPGTNDNARFVNPGAAGDATINNTVSANTTVRSLWYGQTNGQHNTLIPAGVTLTVRGTNDNGYGRLGSDPNATAPSPDVASTLYVGTKTESAVNQVVTATISGEGTLSLNNTNNEVNVRQAWGAGGGPHRSVLDMSGLNTFNANLSRIRVGDGEAGVIRRVEAQVFLAKTNRITLNGPSLAEDVQLLVGNNDVNNNGNGSISHLVLGQDNVFNIDHVLIGARKQQGNMRFLETLVGPTLRMRGSDGSSRVVAFRVGDTSDQAGSGNPTTGTVNLGGGTIDILADTVVVGKGQSQAGGGGGTGFLTLGAGTLNANTIEVGYQAASDAGHNVAGTVNVNGTTVTVNNMLRLARSAGALAIRTKTATLNINGGSVMVNGSYRNEGTVNINITNGSLTLPPASQIAASVLTVDGGALSNAAVVMVTNALAIANAGTIAGNPVFDMGNLGANWNVQGASGGSLTVSNTLQGVGNLHGDLVQGDGGVISPGGSVPGTLSVLPLPAGGNATFNAGALRFDLANSSLGNNDHFVIGGTLTLAKTNDVFLTALDGAFGIGDPYTLITAGTLVGDHTYFRVAGALADSRYTFDFDTAFVPNGVVLIVGGSGPAGLTWVGDGSANLWNLKGAANWTDGVSPQQFFSLDAVTFNDSGSAAPAVVLAGVMNPGSVTVNNPTKNYNFSGTGGVQGGALTKDGAGVLTFGSGSENSFSGPVTIQAGAVTFSNNGRNTFANGIAVNGGSLTFLPGNGENTNAMTAGSLTIAGGASVTVANSKPNSFGATPVQLDGSLTINQAVDSSLDGPISGAGALIKVGVGVLTLASDNSALTAPVLINAGTIKAGAANALGTVGATIASGASLNINGQNLLTLPVSAVGAGPDGNGAIVNVGAPQLNALANVTLTGHTTIGGSGPWSTDPVLNRGRWDVRGGTLGTGGQPFNLTKRGSNQVSIANATVDTALGDIDVQQGLLGFEGTTTSMGDSSRTIFVRAGGTVSFFDTTIAWAKNFAVFGNGTTPSLLNYNGANTVAGPVTLSGNCLIGGVPADRGTPVSLTLSGPVGGGGGITKIGGDRLILSGAYTYSGNTVVNAGALALNDVGALASAIITINAGATLDVSGSLGGGLALASGQTLNGNGTVNGHVTANSGSTVSPGLSLGVLSIAGDLTLEGTTAMELSAASDTNDVLRATTFIDLGGTLVLTIVDGTLAAGDSFKLFDALGYADSFASIVPTTPGPGLTWDTTALNTDGILGVRGPQGPQISPPSISGGGFNLGGSGGTPNQTYRVVASTDVSVPVSNWTPILTNTFDSSGNFSVTIPINPGTPQRFFLLRVP